MPFLVIIAGLIWLTNRRPVIFKQERFGRDEPMFTLYKFRTMNNAGEMDRRIFTPGKMIPASHRLADF